MSLVQLTLDSLKILDGGKPEKTFNKQMALAIADCLDRPTDDRVRKVTLELSLEPIAEETDVTGVFICTGIDCQFKGRTKIPDRQTKTYNFGVSRNGQLYFSETSPTNVNQTTFDDIDPESGRVVREYSEAEEDDEG